MNQMGTYDGYDRTMSKVRYTNAFLLAVSYEIKIRKKNNLKGAGKVFKSR
jgi:hypothetical protein